jgi:hypothetical protein
LVLGGTQPTATEPAPNLQDQRKWVKLRKLSTKHVHTTPITDYDTIIDDTFSFFVSTDVMNLATCPKFRF